MANFYYLVSQLPAISISVENPVKPPLTYEYFQDLCHRFLEGDVLSKVEKLSLEPPKNSEKTGSCFLDGWYSWERGLRLSMAQFRAGKMKKEFSDSGLASVTQDIQQIARNACNFESPLDAEKYLNGERVKKIDELTPTDIFCADNVFAYGLKLQMANRIVKFDKDAGMSSYRIIYDQILGESK